MILIFSIAVYMFCIFSLIVDLSSLRGSCHVQAMSMFAFLLGVARSHPAADGERAEGCRIGEVLHLGYNDFKKRTCQKWNSGIGVDFLKIILVCNILRERERQTRQNWCLRGWWIISPKVIFQSIFFDS